MKLHWTPKSPFVRKVLLAAHETGTADRIELVLSKIGQPSINRDVQALNPIGKIPVLEIEGETPLFDSAAICEYLDQLHDGPPFFPAWPARRDALRWQALGDGLLEQALLWRNESLRPDGERSQRFMDSYMDRLCCGLDALERESSALTEAPFAIGHVAIGNLIGFVDARIASVDWRDGRPGLARWFESFDARESSRRFPVEPPFVPAHLEAML